MSIFKSNRELSDSVKVALTTFIKADIVRMTGVEPKYHTVDSEQSIETFNGLREWYYGYKEWYAFSGIRASFPVLANGDTGSIYGPELNELVRYWHDLHHVIYDLNFSCKADCRIAASMADKIATCDYLSLDLSNAVYYDFAGQAKYYDKHKRFIKDGTGFVHQCISHGIDHAIQHWEC